MRKYLFNNATWPDFTRLPNHLVPAVRFQEFESEVPVVIDGVKFTPIPVDHLVPTHGFLIEQDGAAVLWSSDTGPTQRFWEIANRTPEPEGAVHRHQLRQLAAAGGGRLAPPDAADPGARAAQAAEAGAHPPPPPEAALRRAASRRRSASCGNPDLEFLEQGREYKF